MNQRWLRAPPRCRRSSVFGIACPRCSPVATTRPAARKPASCSPTTLRRSTSTTRWVRSGGRSNGSLLRRHRAEIGDDRVEIRVGHVRIEAVAHWGLKVRAILAHAFGDRLLDLRVAPGTDTLFFTRGDVARHGRAPRSRKFAPALAERTTETLRSLWAERGVAF